MAKKYNIKVYSKAGVYLATWNEAINGIAFSNEINSAGGQMTIILGRNAGDYGEGSDIDFGNRVSVTCLDKESVDGQIIFQGYISGYTPIYKDNNIEVTLLSYGAELNDYIVEAGESLDIEQSQENDVYYSFGNLGTPDETNRLAQTITAVGNDSWTKMELDLVTVNNAGGTYHKNVPVKIEVYAGLTPEAGDIIATSSTIRIVDATPAVYSFVFVPAIEYTDGQEFCFVLVPLTYDTGSAKYVAGVSTDILNPYSNGGVWRANNLAKDYEWLDVTSVGLDWWFKLYKSTGHTYAPFNSYDPSYIVKAVIKDYNNNGGSVTYTDDSIENTDTVVSYTFNINTALEAIQKCIELAPVNWYWYLDYGTNLINFKSKSSEPDHVFTLEKDIIDARFEKRIEDIVNTIYLTGGDTGGGENLYIKYTDDESIAEYGIKAIKYIDGRITNTNTADTICNSILENKSQPELRVTLTILDSNNNSGKGYDIESIKVGDVVAVRNMTQQIGLSTWDIARWDNSYFDYNVFNLSSLQMQVQRIEYAPDYAVVYASTMAVDVNKRIEDINRNLEALQTADNPITPS